MENIKLNVKREKAWVGAAVPYRVLIDGREVAKLSLGGSKTIEIPNRPIVLKVSMVGNSMAIHNIEKQVIIYPQYCKTGMVNCIIHTKIQWGGAMTLGIAQAMAKMDIEVNYC